VKGEGVKARSEKGEGLGLHPLLFTRHRIAQ
jgi:hypothetical protein